MSHKDAVQRKIEIWMRLFFMCLTSVLALVAAAATTVVRENWPLVGIAMIGIFVAISGTIVCATYLRARLVELEEL